MEHEIDNLVIPETESIETFADISATQRNPQPPFPDDLPPFATGRNPNVMPTTAPPNFIPPRPISAFRVDPQSIRNCMHRFTYIWMDNGTEFWMFPVQLGRHSVSGFRFHRPFGWTFFGVSLNRINAFTCV